MSGTVFHSVKINDVTVTRFGTAVPSPRFGVGGPRGSRTTVPREVPRFGSAGPSQDGYIFVKIFYRFI